MTRKWLSKRISEIEVTVWISCTEVTVRRTDDKEVTKRISDTEVSVCISGTEVIVQRIYDNQVTVQENFWYCSDCLNFWYRSDCSEYLWQSSDCPREFLILKWLSEFLVQKWLFRVFMTIKWLSKRISDIEVTVWISGTEVIAQRIYDNQVTVKENFWYWSNCLKSQATAVQYREQSLTSLSTAASRPPLDPKAIAV